MNEKHWTEYVDGSDREEAFIDQNYTALNDKFYHDSPEDYHEEIFDDPIFWDFCHEEYEKAMLKLEEVYE